MFNLGGLFNIASPLIFCLFHITPYVKTKSNPCADERRSRIPNRNWQITVHLYSGDRSILFKTTIRENLSGACHVLNSVDKRGFQARKPETERYLNQTSRINPWISGIDCQFSQRYAGKPVNVDQFNDLLSIRSLPVVTGGYYGLIDNAFDEYPETWDEWFRKTQKSLL